MRKIIAATIFATVLLLHVAVAVAQTATPSPESTIWEPWRNSSATLLLDQGSGSTRARFNNAGDLLAVTSGDAVTIRRVRDGAIVRRFALAAEYVAGAWRPGSTDVAVAHSDGSVSVYADDGTLLHRFETNGRVLRLAWSPNGDNLAVGGWNGLLRLYSVRDKKLLLSPDVGPETVFGLAFSSSGKQLAVRTQDECLTFLNTESGAVDNRFIDQGLNGSIRTSGELYAIDHTNSLSVLNSRTHETLLTIEARFPSNYQWLPNHGLVFTDDGDQLEFADSSGKRQLRFRCTQGYVTDLSATNDGERVVVVDSDHRVIVWNTASLESLEESTRHTIPEIATFKGRYSDLLAVCEAPEDESVFGESYDFGQHPMLAGASHAYWVYSSPNWYLFGKSRIRMNRPPQVLPEPVAIADGTSFLWLAFPGAICGGSFAEAVDRLPKDIPQIKDATLSYNHGFAFPDPSKNFALAVLTLNIKPGVDTATILELLGTHARLSLNDGAVLTHAQALESGLLKTSKAR